MINNTYQAVETQQSPMWAWPACAGFLFLVALIVCLQQGVRKVMVAERGETSGAGLFGADDYMYLPVIHQG